jgi:hypothetical protein
MNYIEYLIAAILKLYNEKENLHICLCIEELYGLILFLVFDDEPITDK